MLAVAACSTAEPELPVGEVVAEFGDGVVGVAAAPAVDTDELPVYQLVRGNRALDIAALDAVVDTDTATLAWIDPAGALWVAPIDRAPASRRQVAGDVILGLAARGGKLAYAVRHDGPETAPFVTDLRTFERTALDDGPGPDEVMGFSPDGREVLLLSGRTGLASLFATDVAGTAARQLTNIGLAPGPDLDTTRVMAAPAHRSDVDWSPRGLVIHAGGATLEVRP